MKSVLVTNKNKKHFCELFEKIFPNEDKMAILSAMEYTKIHNNYDELEYYITKSNNKSVGIYGFYKMTAEEKDKDDRWLGWFGVLPDKRNKGYGSQILKEFEKKSLEKGCKTVRLYTDDSYIDDKIYIKNGYIKEKFEGLTDDKNINESIKNNTYKMYIFSKSLKNEKISLWNNKYLNL